MPCPAWAFGSTGGPPAPAWPSRILPRTSSAGRSSRCAAEDSDSGGAWTWPWGPQEPGPPDRGKSRGLSGREKSRPPATPRPAVKSGPARKAIPVNSAAYSSPCDDNPKDRSIIPVFPPQYKENHRNSKGFQAETSGAGAFAPAPDSAGLIISPSPWRRSPQRSSPASSRCPRPSQSGWRP